jgi:SAM-dependent methyltransferase
MFPGRLHEVPGDRHPSQMIMACFGRNRIRLTGRPNFLLSTLHLNQFVRKETMKEYWDAIFSSREDAQLGWYEKDASKMLQFLAHIPDWEHAAIFVCGAGTSVLTEELARKTIRLTINDISTEALKRVKERLGSNAEKVLWICQDISHPLSQDLPQSDIWIDRAVLHFLTEEESITRYFSNLKTVLRAGGHAIFAEFSTKGAEQCAGLGLHRYSTEELAARLGDEFTLVTQHDHIYINPAGHPRPYIYALFKRNFSSCQ